MHQPEDRRSKPPREALPGDRGQACREVPGEAGGTYKDRDGGERGRHVEQGRAGARSASHRRGVLGTPAGPQGLYLRAEFLGWIPKPSICLNLQF